MFRKGMVPETGEPQSKENNRLGDTCGNVHPVDRKRFFPVRPAPSAWNPCQWQGYARGA